MAWEKGDIAQLKTGGPRMTVQDVMPEMIACSWFDKSDKLQHGTFVAESLVKPEDLKNVEISFVAAPKQPG
jgi:uncharacterized protein YodC (DUF2158 family)